MPRPIDDELRAAILDDINAGQLSRNAIARKHDVSASTVTKVARQAKKPDAFDRSKTRDATRARMADIADLRSRLALRNLARAHRVHDRLDADTYEVKVVAADGRVVTVRTPDPPALDEKNLAAAVASYANAADRLAPPNTDTAGSVRSMLDKIGDALTRAAKGNEPDGG